MLLVLTSANIKLLSAINEHGRPIKNAELQRTHLETVCTLNQNTIFQSYYVTHMMFIVILLVSRKNCFTTDYFKGCLDVLLLQDEMEKYQTWIKQLHGAEPGV
jgi:hypothetical protein